MQQLDVDWLQLPEGCRSLIVQYMDSVTRAAWRTVCQLACRDVHAATCTLTWRGPYKARLSGVPLSNSALCTPSTTLPAAPHLRHLNCSGMSTLRSIQGIPSTLRSLDLWGCHSLASIAPLQHCTALEHLALSDCHAEDWASLVATSATFMSAVGCRVLRLRLSVFDQHRGTQAEAVLRFLGPFTGLQELTLHLDYYESERWQMLPQCIGQMTDLRVLDLTGAVASAMSVPAIRQLRKLQRLNMSSYGLNSERTRALAQAIASLPACLTCLDLGSAGAEMAGVPSLAPALQRQSSTLRAINLYDIQLGPDGMSALAASVQRCSVLTDLNLKRCGIASSGSASLATALSGSAPRLTSLNISDNRLRDEGVVALAPVLSRMTALVKLDYSQNKMGTASAAALAGALSSIAPSLTSLDIYNTQIGDEATVVLAPALSRMTSLVKLDYSGTNIGPVGAAALADALAPIGPSLTSLDLSFNPIGEDGAAALAPALVRMTALTSLFYNYSNLGPVGAALFAAALPAMTHLTLLDLSSNCIGFEGLRALAEGLQALSGRQRWAISFYGPLLGHDFGPRDPQDAEMLASIISGMRCVWDWRLQSGKAVAETAPVKVLGVEVTRD